MVLRGHAGATLVASSGALVGLQFSSQLKVGDAESTNTALVKKPKAAPAAPPAGDLSFLRAAPAEAPSELLSAISQLLPDLDAHLAHAKAAALTSESLADVVRRSHARAGRGKRRRC